MIDPNQIQHLLALKAEELRAADLRFKNLIAQNVDGILTIDKNGVILYANYAAQNILNRQINELVGSDFGFPVAESGTEIQITKPDGNVVFAEMKIADSEWEQQPVSLVSLRDITDRKIHQIELELLTTLNTSLRKADSIDEMIRILIIQTAEKLHAVGAALWIDKAPGTKKRYSQVIGELENSIKDTILPMVAEENEKFFYCKTTSDSDIANDRYDVIIQLTTKDGVLGWMMFRRGYAFNTAEQSLLNQVSGIAASALHRSILFEETNKRMERLSALRDIDMAITSSLEIHTTLKLVINHMQNQTKADAICVLDYNPDSLVLTGSDTFGIPSEEFEGLKLFASGDIIGSAIINQTVHSSDNLLEENLDPRLKKVFILYRLKILQVVPMIARGKVLGVILFLYRQKKELEPDVEDFIHALVIQAAIGIDNASLFHEIQRFNIELRNAYDETIEGWARAVSLRNQETEQHTRRVAEMAVDIAERFYPFSKNECRNIWYGALLHDIGKIAVPDKILFKPGPLDADEWVIMKKHPEIAYETLASISYLHQALDIPLYHHEHWNGNGYPRQLKGKEIPLCARLFSLIDVWDALTSERPYRKPWSKERTLQYIQDQSGIQFDPAIVPIFIEYIGKYYSGKITPSILIVDDEPNILRSLERSLREEYDVYTSETLSGALEIIDNHPIQIVISDQRMPEIEGIQLIKQIKQKRPDVIGLLLSGYTDTEVLIEALNLGYIRGFIPKPWEINRVKEKIADALDFYQLMIAIQNHEQRNRGNHG